MELLFWHMKDEVHLENCLTFEQLGKEINDYKAITINLDASRIKSR